MATEGTKYQVNFKTNDGTLINLYAATVTELESGLADLSMNALNIKATATELNGGATATVASIASAFNATPVAPSSALAQGAGNACKHGAMIYKTGTSSKGAWQGWMCPTPKGAPDKCDTIWVK